MVVETNNGGDMVLEVLKQANVFLPVRKCTASRGKGKRAEPVAVLFENGRAGLAGRFAELEGELRQMTAQGFVGKGSPDRADAMVWAMNELSGRARAAGVRGL